MSEFDSQNLSSYLRAMIESAMRRCIELAKEAASKGQYPLCASAAVWAKMEGIAFGTSQKTAADWGAKKNDPEFSFRQINIECKDVVARGTPSLRILPGVFMDECDALLTLAGRK